MGKVMCEPLFAERGRTIDDDVIAELADRFLHDPVEAERLSKFIHAYIIDDSESFLTGARGNDEVRFSQVHGTFVDPMSRTIYQMRTDDSGYHKEVYKCATKAFHGVLTVPARVFDARSSSDLTEIGADFYSSDNAPDNMRPLLESKGSYEPEHATEPQPNRNSLRMQKHEDGSIEGWVNDGRTEQERRVYSLESVLTSMEQIAMAQIEASQEVQESTFPDYINHMGNRALVLGRVA